jgi:glycerate 2-kinase
VTTLDIIEGTVKETAKDLLKEMFRAALDAVDPYRAVARNGDEILETYKRGRYDKLYVVGFGKAVSGMTRAAVDLVGDVITGGISITKYGHSTESDRAGAIRIYEAGHPLPDNNGMKTTGEIMELAKSFDDKTLAVFLISGGGSALLVAPYAGVSLDEKQKTTDLLLKAGADINELNAVRKHISAVKGGRLAELAYPATIRSLILSDVIDDRLDVIASGPTAPDFTTHSDALDVIKKYGLATALPRSVVCLLDDGAGGLVPETPKAGNPVFQRVENRIIGSNKQAIEAGQLRCAELGMECLVIATGVRGEARDVGRHLAEEAISLKETRSGRPGTGRPLCLISGGETTVTVRGNGVGGRNIELALAFGLRIEGTPGITLLSAGTDGTDGPTDAAGAFADGQTMAVARAVGLNPETYLEKNDSYNFFAKTDDLFITGPTGTNVMDLQLILLDGK